MPGVLREPVNLFDFFHERVDAAASNQRAPLSQEGIFYLSNLLAEQSSTARPVDAPQTLVELLLRARDRSPAGGAISDYRELGDRALVLSGFFRSHIERGMVGLDYYLHMGATAYHTLSNLLQVGRSDGSFAAIFAELAGRFSTCSSILNEVEQEVRTEASMDDDAPSDQEILALYERWRATGSPQAARRLQELGLLPSHGSDEMC